MKVLMVCCLTIAVTLAEPPVNNRYLPPQNGFRNGFSAPSQNYGAPVSNGFAGQRQTDAIFGRRPSSNYGAPSLNSRQNRISQNGGVRSNQLSNQYLPPQNFAPSQYSLTPQNYQAPSNQYGTPNQYSEPSNQYIAPTFGRNDVALPNQQYGAPAFGGNQQQPGLRGAERSYLPPGANGYSRNGDEENYEPANYSFEYMVKDEPSGNDFGHREARQGDRAEGLYYVLLPDGRKQTVEYEADENGYKPRISYEDTGLAGGYDSRNQNRYQDYNNGY